MVHRPTGKPGVPAPAPQQRLAVTIPPERNEISWPLVIDELNRQFDERHAAAELAVRNEHPAAARAEYTACTILKALSAALERGIGR